MGDRDCGVWNILVGGGGLLRRLSAVLMAKGVKRPFAIHHRRAAGGGGGMRGNWSTEANTSVRAPLGPKSTVPHCSLPVGGGAGQAPCHNLYWTLRFGVRLEKSCAKGLSGTSKVTFESRSPVGGLAGVRSAEPEACRRSALREMGRDGRGDPLPPPNAVGHTRRTRGVRGVLRGNK